MVRKIILCLSCASLFVLGEVIEVSADRIVSNQAKGKTIMSGNVVIQRQEDILHANRVIINMGEDKRPSKYEAIGKVDFTVKTNDGRIMQGKAQRIIYDAKKEEYRLLGKAWVQEKDKKNAIRGEAIVFNRKDGSASVEGDKKKPAKIIFTLEGNKD